LGGIHLEVFKDISSALAPVSKEEALTMIKRLKSYPIIKGTRGKVGINETVLADTIQRVSALIAAAPEIQEMDINPLMGCGDTLVAVDARIRVQGQLECCAIPLNCAQSMAPHHEKQSLFAANT
jgi:acetyltransferase